MPTIFDGYDDEYKSLAQSLSTQMHELASYEDAREKRRAMTQASDLITEAMQLIDQMELEVRSLDAATRRELSTRVKTYRDHMRMQADDLKRMTTNEDKKQLVGSAEARSRMQASTQTLERTGKRISEAHQAALEIEDTAMGIQQELGRNRETIQATLSKVKDVNAMAQAAERIIGRMTARNKRQNLFGIFGD